MSPRSAYDVQSASAIVRQLQEVDPAAARAYVEQCRAFAEERAAGAVTDRDRRIAAALDRSANAAESALAELGVPA